MDKSQVSITQLHKNTGVPITSIQRMRSDPTANPTIASLKPIADFFNISINQLIGEDPLTENEFAGVYIENKIEWASIPLITWKQVVSWPNNYDKAKKYTLIATDIGVGKNAYALKVLDEMEDGFRKGSMIIVDPNIEPNDMDYVIAHKVGSAEASLKNFRVYDGEIYLKPLNKHFNSTVFNQDYKVLGTVVQIKFNLI